MKILKLSILVLIGMGASLSIALILGSQECSFDECSSAGMFVFWLPSWALAPVLAILGKAARLVPKDLPLTSGVLSVACVMPWAVVFALGAGDAAGAVVTLVWPVSVSVSFGLTFSVLAIIRYIGTRERHSPSPSAD